MNASKEGSYELPSIQEAVETAGDEMLIEDKYVKSSQSEVLNFQSKSAISSKGLLK